MGALAALGARPVPPREHASAVARARPGRGPLVVPAIIAGAWLAIVAAQATGAAAALHHHALIEDGPPLLLAIPLFMAGWLVMAAAMMLPASLPAIRQVEAAAAGFARPRRLLAPFLASVAAVWVLFGVAAFLGDVVVHHVVDTTPWLAERAWLIEAGVLALAGAWQFAPDKRRMLRECRDPVGAMGSDARSALGPARLGLRHGLACLGTAWALMLVMFGEGFGGLGWMVVLSAVMAGEVSERHGARIATAAGLVLLLASLATLSAPAGLGS